MKCVICHRNKSNDEFYRRNSIYKSCNVCSDKAILRRQKKSHEQEVKEVEDPLINDIIIVTSNSVLEPEPKQIIQKDQTL